MAALSPHLVGFYFSPGKQACVIRNRVTRPAIMFLLPRFALGGFLLLQLRFETFFQAKRTVSRNRNRAALYARTAFLTSLNPPLFISPHNYSRVNTRETKCAHLNYLFIRMYALFYFFFSFDKMQTVDIILFFSNK